MNNSLANGHTDWCKGKIYSVEVKDFVTYDHVAYYPGAHLNIILGPNGTGKSTLVAAIVLGMGGQPKTLSRSQNIEDYVKNGKERAEIEILLFKDSKHKSKFKRMFNTNGQNKYYVDNVECSYKKYVEHVAQFNIQINNLCQFLPQDRVQDFAKMNPQELLHNTQSSVCSPECGELFEQLKQLRAQQKGDGNNLIAQMSKLNENEAKVASLKEQVDNINLKSTLSEQLDICNKKKAWMEFEELYIKFKEIENDQKIGIENQKRAEGELAPLKDQSNQIARLKQIHQENIKSEAEKAQSCSVELNKLDEKSCKFQEAIVKAEGDLKFAKQTHEENIKELQLAILKQRAFVEDVRKAAEIAGNEDDKKTRINEIMRERNACTEKVRSLSDLNRKTIRQLSEEINPRLNSIANKIKQLENSKNVKLELLRTRYDQVHQGVMWLRQNQNRFKGKVYEPLILEVTRLLRRLEACSSSFCAEELYIKFKEIENDQKIGIENQKRAEGELAPLKDQSNQIARLKQIHQENIKSEAEKAQSCSVELNKLDEKSCKFQEAIVKAEGDLKFAKQTHEESIKELQLAILKQRAFVEDVRKAAEIAGNEDDKKTRINEIMRERNACTEKVRSLSDLNRKTIRQLSEEINPRLNSIANKIKQLENSKNVKLELLRTRYDQVHQGVMWLRQNQNRFKGKVYEPLILELNVKEGFSKYFENVIAIRDLLAFSCENNDDVKTLFNCLRKEQNLNVNIIHTKAVRTLEFASPSIAEISKFGFNHFLLELVDGPLPIINYLCRTYAINAVPIGTEHTLSMVESVPAEYNLFFTPNHRFASITSLYSGQRSTESQEISGRNLLNVAIDYGALENYKMQREDMLRQSDRCRNEQGRIETDIKEYEVKINDLDTQKGQIEKHYLTVEMCKRNLQRQIKHVEDLQANAIDLDKETENFNKKAEAILKSLMETQTQKLVAVKKLKVAANATDCHRKKQRIFLRSTAELENRIQEAQEKLNAAIRYVNNIKLALDDAKEKCKRQQAIACKLTDNKKPTDARHFPYRKQFDELPDTMDELVDHMNEIQGQMECVRNCNAEVIPEYENLIRDIERLKSAIESAKSNQSNLDNQMDSVYEKWKEIIVNVVTEINRNFANFMMLMGFAGEVQLICPNQRDYADYGIAIRVKYRSDEQLQSLDRFVQSGGERAVAIAAYTLSLQHMSHVPFRCVDEINQGMDPTNERRIFDMLVKETSQAGKSQFFFVTPKLLTDLSYNEYMTVSIIFNDGEAIGINSMKVTAGISFAIPIDYAKDFLKRGTETRSKGLPLPTVKRYMGITMLTLTDDILRELRQRSSTVPDDIKHGVLVWKVIIGSPANIGGLAPGDIITHINGKSVSSSGNIYEALGEKGSALVMTVVRGNARIQLAITPEDYDS